MMPRLTKHAFPFLNLLHLNFCFNSEFETLAKCFSEWEWRHIYLETSISFDKITYFNTNASKRHTFLKLLIAGNDTWTLSQDWCLALTWVWDANENFQRVIIASYVQAFYLIKFSTTDAYNIDKFVEFLFVGYDI